MASIVYRRLSFEDDLFTARVYKRNYRNQRLQVQHTKELDIERTSTTHQVDIRRHQVRCHNLEWLFLDGRHTTLVIGGEDVNEIEKEDEEGETNSLNFAITVSTSCSTSTEEIAPNIEVRMGPSRFGHDGLHVKLGSYLEHRLHSSASAAYVDLVLTCGRGDNVSVKKQLANFPTVTPGSPEASTLLGSYLSGSKYFCPIHAAVFNGHIEVMKTLLRRATLEQDLGRVVEKVIGGTEHDPWRPLHVATIKGDLFMVELLLENGAFIHAKTGLGIRAIHLAAKVGSKKVLEALIREGSNPGCRDIYGLQPLHYATSSQDVPDVIDYLVSTGANVDDTSYKDKLTPLHMACKYDFIGNVQALLRAKPVCPMNDRAAYKSALDLAIRHGSLLSIEALLLQGASMSKFRPNGLTGLGTFVEKSYGSHLTSSHDEWPKERILRLILHYTNRLTVSWYGHKILDVLSPIKMEQDESATIELARLMWDNFSELEKWTLRLKFMGPYLDHNERWRIPNFGGRPLKNTPLIRELFALYEKEEQESIRGVESSSELGSDPDVVLARGVTVTISQAGLGDGEGPGLDSK